MCLRSCSRDNLSQKIMAIFRAPLTQGRCSAARLSLIVGLLAPLSVYGQDIVEGQTEQERLEQAVEALEATGDTWHPMIAESMISLARLLQADGNHTEALATLERAVHISRVNHGLFSLQQGPAIKMQVESHLALGEWEEADSLEQYHFYIHSRSLGEGNAELIPALLSYAEWHVEAFAERRGELPATRLIDAYRLYSAVMSLIDAQPEPERYPRERYLHRLAYLSWLMQRTGVQSRPETLYAKTRQVDDNWADRITDGQYRLHNNPFLQGEYVLEQIIAMRQRRVEESAPGSSIQREMKKLHAEAVLDMADWNLLFDRRQRAESVYKQAWSLLANEDEALKKDVFDRVVLIPSFENFMQPERTTELTEGGSPAMATAFSSTRPVRAESRRSWPWVTMRFDLTRNGRVTNVEVLEASTEINENVRRNMVMALRGSVIRPALRDGAPDITRGLVYRFPYDPSRIAGSETDTESSGQSAETADNTTAGIESALNEAQ
jgi:tetratricopeptide (TPR) repeat protein